MINVKPRKWMRKMREALGIEREKMAVACKCSDKLLEIMEEHGAITLPGIACRIARRYGMDVHQYNTLVHPDKKARVLPAWKEPPTDRGFTWSRYHAEHVSVKEAEAF